MKSSISFFPSLCLWLMLFGFSACSHAEDPAETSQHSPAANTTGEDWPRFLGPSEIGISSESGLLKQWPEDGPPKLWQIDVGTGYSAPSVLGERVVIHHRLKDEELVQCLERDSAKTLWTHRSPSQFSDPYGYNNGPRCTPLLTTNRCFTYGAEGRLLCLNLDNGTVIWERELHKEYDVPEAFFGVGATPILEGNKLIVFVGGQPNSGVVALDAESGKTLWENVGQSTWDGAATGWRNPETYTWTGEEMIVSYSSPIAATFHGKRHILCLLRHGLVSLDPETGTEYFRYWFRSTSHESVNAARPVVRGNQILLSAAYRNGAALLEVQPDGKTIKEVWRNSRNLLTHWSTPIPVGDYVYGFSGRHENGSTLRCLEWQTGNLVWETTGWQGPIDHLSAFTNSSVVNILTKKVEPWPYYGRGSKILVDGQFIVLGERGTVALISASSTGFEELSRFKPEAMNYPCWAAPVLSRGILYLRSENALICYDLRAGNSKTRK